MIEKQTKNPQSESGKDDKGKYRNAFLGKKDKNDPTKLTS